MNLIVDAPINNLSFGNVAMNVLRELYKKKAKISLFPKGEMDFTAFDNIDKEFKGWIDNSYNYRFHNLNKEYPTLRTIVGFYKFLAYGMVVITIGFFILGLMYINDNERDLGTILMLGSVVVGSITVITLLAMSEGIILFVNMANDLSEVKMSLDDQ